VPFSLLKINVTSRYQKEHQIYSGLLLMIYQRRGRNLHIYL